MNLKEISDEELVDDIIDDSISKDFPQYKTELLIRLARGRKAIEACESVFDLINNSRGIAGLHLNGDDAPWDELLRGGRFETWLIKLSEFEEVTEKQIKEATDDRG